MLLQIRPRSKFDLPNMFNKLDKGWIVNDQILKQNKAKIEL